jgi:hypothetical protein
MPRTRKTRTATAARHSNPPVDPSTSTESPPTAAGKPNNKTQAVLFALKSGLDSPTEIADYIRNKFGMDMSADHVSTVKGNLIKKGLVKGKPGRKRRKGKGGRPRKEQPAAEKPARTAKKGGEPGLTLDQWRTLADIASAVGGYDHLQEYLAVLRLQK